MFHFSHHLDLYLIIVDQFMNLMAPLKGLDISDHGHTVHLAIQKVVHCAECVAYILNTTDQHDTTLIGRVHLVQVAIDIRMVCVPSQESHDMR